LFTGSQGRRANNNIKKKNYRICINRDDRRVGGVIPMLVVLSIRSSIDYTSPTTKRSLRGGYPKLHGDHNGEMQRHQADDRQLSPSTLLQGSRTLASSYIHLASHVEDLSQAPSALPQLRSLLKPRTWKGSLGDVRCAFGFSSPQPPTNSAIARSLQESGSQDFPT
jgi:hypothetical protein